MDITVTFKVDADVRRRVLRVAWSSSRLFGGWFGYAVGCAMAASFGVGASFAVSKSDAMLLLHPIVLFPGLVAIMFLGNPLWLRLLLAIGGRSGRDIEATCRLTDDQLRLEWDRGTVVVPWTEVRRLVRGKDIWFFMHRKGRSVFMPVEVVTTELGDFIVEKVSAGGGKVK
jgi:hypothetical protein